ncbi:MAG: hypothetical protein K8W52_38715 [Deltaproteobacteria bacterium]|nr:hypothetical protein [Deltaproteobacteria bacterium]
MKKQTETKASRNVAARLAKLTPAQLETTAGAGICYTCGLVLSKGSI